jgi:methyl-accepting chemotaxis protein
MVTNRIGSGAMGIRGKLLLAFGGVAAGTVIVGMVGWASLGKVGTLLDGVANRNLPQVAATLQLAAHSTGIAAGAPALFAAVDEAERGRQRDAIRRERDAIEKALSDLAKLDQSASIAGLKQLAEETDGKVAALDKAVGERLQLAVRQKGKHAELVEKRRAFTGVSAPALAQVKNQVAAASMSIGGDAAALTRLVLRLLGTSVPAQQRLTDLISDMGALDTLYDEVTAATDEKAIDGHAKDFAAIEDRATENLDVLARINKVDGLREAADAILAFGKGDESIFALRRQELKSAAGGMTAMAATRDVVGKLVAAVNAEVERVEAAAAGAAKASDGAITTGILMMLLVSALSVAGAVLLVWLYVGRNLIARLTALGKVMTVIAEGNLSVAVSGTEQKDEIGAMARALGVFKDGLQRSKQLADEQAAEQAARAERAQKVDALTRAFDQTIGTALNAVDASATGMCTSADTMIKSAGDTTRQTNSAASAAGRATSNVETVASAAEELSASIAEIGRQVTESARIAADAVARAEHTNSSVEGLAEAAKKIGSVVSLINDIAGQTNLLALNATIEAARAGDAGKGFAVVASEVKSLANQTAQATGEIANQVNEIQSATSGAVNAIREIKGTIQNLNDIAASIAAATQEQGAATQEIARNVQEAAKSTQMVSSDAAAATGSADETSKQAGAVMGAAQQVLKQSEALKSRVDQVLGQIRAA